MALPARWDKRYMLSDHGGHWSVYDMLNQTYLVDSKNGVQRRFRSERAAQKALATYIREDPTHGPDWQAPSNSSNPQVGSLGASIAAAANATNAFAFKAATGHEPPTVEDEDQPIIAHRAAFIAFDQGFHFASLNDRSYFSVFEENAVCRTSTHKAPDINCSCGFYAVPTGMKAMESSGTVDLLVELSGLIQVHSAGFRAETQLVLELRLPPCTFCCKPAELTLWSSDGGYLSSSCSRHKVNTTGWSEFVIIETAELAEVAGVPITVDPTPRPPHRSYAS